MINLRFAGDIFSKTESKYPSQGQRESVAQFQVNEGRPIDHLNKGR